VSGVWDEATALATGVVFPGRTIKTFPLRERGKVPITKRGLYDASADPEQIAAWRAQFPGANLGMPTGEMNSLVVIDLDGDEGACSWGSLLSDHPGTPAEVAVRTGSGWHLYFLMPTGAKVGNSAGRIAPGIDVRGTGGYVVVPPSIHESGALYEWRSHPGDCLVPELPDWLVALVAKGDRVQQRTPVRPRFDSGGGTPYGRAALKAELEELARAQEGTRNAALNSAAFSIGQLVAGGELHAEPAAAALEEMGLAIGLTESEVDKTIASGMAAGREMPRQAPAREALA
jgi:hypothetical protein